MDVTRFMASISNTFISKYQMRARSETNQIQGLNQESLKVAERQNFEPKQLDTVNISAVGLESGRKASSPEAAAAAPTQDAKASKVEPPVKNSAPVLRGPVVRAGDDDADSSDSKVPQTRDQTEQAPESATSTEMSMRSNLSIRMKMQFSMRSIVQMAQRIENGETTSMEELKQASFGLKADFRARGMTRTEVRTGSEVSGGHEGKGGHEVRGRGDDDDGDRAERRQGHGHRHHGDVSRFRSKTSLSMRRAGGYEAQGADFSLRGFFKENMRVRESLKVQQHGEHRIATRKFEMRYKFDSTFNIQHMSSFNSQTEKMAGGDEGRLSSFLAQAGNVAETGSTQMMASFFDTVEGYLNNAEDQMLANATAFLNAASSEMGEGFAMKGIGELITSRIESFFDAVDSAVNALKSLFMGPEAVEEVAAIEEVVAQPEVAVSNPITDSKEASKVFA